MTLFIGFTLLCFVGGVVLWRVNPAHRSKLLLALCLFMAFAYYFLDQL
ncbi:MAG: hypothetical protein IT327_14055 [Anaerolineae bacterium]|jgi:hypothetical protein|nr:hypothetical protein [Anaerolineae bacterium]